MKVITVALLAGLLGLSQSTEVIKSRDETYEVKDGGQAHMTASYGPKHLYMTVIQQKEADKDDAGEVENRKVWVVHQTSNFPNEEDNRKIYWSLVKFPPTPRKVALQDDEE